MILLVVLIIPHKSVGPFQARVPQQRVWGGLCLAAEEGVDLSRGPPAAHGQHCFAEPFPRGPDLCSADEEVTTPLDDAKQT